MPCTASASLSRASRMSIERLLAPAMRNRQGQEITPNDSGRARFEPAVLIEWIFADEGVPALTDPVLHSPAEGISRDHGREGADGALRHGPDDRALDAAVAVLTVDRGPNQCSKQIRHDNSPQRENRLGRARFQGRTEHQLSFTVQARTRYSSAHATHPAADLCPSIGSPYPTNDRRLAGGCPDSDWRWRSIWRCCSC